MHPWYRTILTLAGGVIQVVGRPEIRGRERVPLTGGLIVAANHGSFWDPPVTATSLPRETFFLAKEELFRVPGFGALIRSVNAIPIRRGVGDLSGIARALDVLREGKCLLMFPEGGRMKDGKLHRAKPGLGLIATHARVPVVPVYLSGTNHIRRCLARKERIRVQFGHRLSAEALLEGDAETGRALYQRVSDRVMEAITQLKRASDGPEADSAPGPTERGASY